MTLTIEKRREQWRPASVEWGENDRIYPHRESGNVRGSLAIVDWFEDVHLYIRVEWLRKDHDLKDTGEPH